MAGALPPVTDCGCSPTSSTTATCCPLSGVGNPNTGAVVPDDLTVWTPYLQLTDAVNGPIVAVWHWNPNLSLWQVDP